VLFQTKHNRNESSTMTLSSNKHRSVSSSSSSTTMKGRKKMAVSAPLPNLYRTCLLPTLILCVAAAGIFQEQIQQQVTLSLQSMSIQQQQHDNASGYNNHKSKSKSGWWTPEKEEQQQQHINGKTKRNSVLWTQLLPNTFQSDPVFAVVLVEHKQQHNIHNKDQQHQHARTISTPTLSPGLDEDGAIVGDEKATSTSTLSKPSRPASARARRQRRHREARKQQQQQLLQSMSDKLSTSTSVSLPLMATSGADQLRITIQHLFGAELLSQAAEQQCQRHNRQSSSSSTASAFNETTTSKMCEAAAVSIYDKEADHYTQQAAGWLVATATKQDVDAMAVTLNQVPTVEAMGTVYAVRIHVDSCDATYVQYEYAYAYANATDVVKRDDSGVTVAAATPNDDSNSQSMVLRNIDDISNHRSNGRHLRRIVQLWNRLQGTFRQRRAKRKQQKHQKKQQKRERKKKQQHEHKRQHKREPKDQKQEQEQQKEQEQQQQQQSQSRTLTNTTTVLRSPSVWLAAARTLVPGRDRFQCLIRTESSV
jgi:hypothetical protein